MTDAFIDDKVSSSRPLLFEIRKWDIEYSRLRTKQAKLDTKAANFNIGRLLILFMNLGVVAGSVGGLVVLLFCEMGH